MQRGRALIIGAAALGLSSVLLPYFEAETLGTVSAATAGAWIPVAAIVGAGFVAAAGDRREGLNGMAAVATAATVTLALVVTGAIAIDAVLAGREAERLGVDAAIRSGLWMLAFATAAATIGVLAAVSRRLS